MVVEVRACGSDRNRAAGSLYLYHSAAFAPNKYALALRVLLLRSEALVCLLRRLVARCASGASLPQHRSRPPPGPKTLAPGRSIGPSQVLWKFDRYGPAHICWDLMGPYRSPASQVLWKIDRYGLARPAILPQVKLPLLLGLSSPSRIVCKHRKRCRALWMPQKIFISYRRQDAAANALGIGQYLENAFGRKNVFIDVDMRAGAKFPTVLEQRLAECKVMIVLIGPDWLTSRDEQGGRRLDSSDDWVRLEIAHALKRDITVIPVLVNGAALPERTALPDDIRGLLDHQAVSVTNAGFRHEMSGLVHDLVQYQVHGPGDVMRQLRQGSYCCWHWESLVPPSIRISLSTFGPLKFRKRQTSLSRMTSGVPVPVNGSCMQSITSPLAIISSRVP